LSPESAMPSKLPFSAAGVQDFRENDPQ